LFLADQNLNGNTAIYTRQNNDGTRRGLECPEERDYYPYWLPTPWVDVAYLTDRADFCNAPPGSPAGTKSFIELTSQNTAQRFKCYDPTGQYRATVLSKTTANSCSDAGGSWITKTWNLPAPICQQSEWTRSNHLGNARGAGTQMASFNWTIPSAATLDLIGATKYNSIFYKCVLRLRYNISTDDYDMWNINVTQSTNQGGKSPVTNDPQVDVGADLQSLRLAIDTSQFGRTFQDRTHIFYIRPLPAALSTAVTGGAKVWNLNVRGKRGNIVQTYPANEYDFTPNRLHVKSGVDYVHIQWTGSNTHDNNPDSEDAGDGQGGDAGEGTGGTDRTNFVEIQDLSMNYPIPLDKFPTTNIFANSNCYKLDLTPIGTNAAGVTNADCAVWLATSGYFRATSQVTGAPAGNDVLSVTLDNAPASLIGGVVMKVNTAGKYYYIGSRNNNFSNRSQKGALIVDP